MIDPSGYTYCHEHLHIDLSSQKSDIDCQLNQFSLICEEMNGLIARGVSNIIEVTNTFMGRNPHFIEDISKKTGINVLMSTGFYIEGFFPEKLYKMTEHEIAKGMIREIVEGIDGSAIKAELIGEIGSSEGTFTETEKKVFRSAVRAQLETGRPISTHQSMSTMGREQIELLRSCGANLEKVTIGHCDLKDNFEHILWMLDQGCYVQFDTIGKNSYYPDEKRVETISKLCERGYANQIMLSMDVTRRSHLKANGGLGFGYLIDNFIPMLERSGVNKHQIDAMLKSNPARLFG
ncbi:phosphotriesterase-related protein [Vibrio aestuarianus]|uniref:phosphotriesterase family protein n=1 Tax=Vibrio aestuarianus TaxID=28171 RepID=UPI00237D1A16|nr:phosphotriesterase-related protein [Vibrio aestuarianus]MDE1239746.1 phosphotriesterase-related protein [Vibrio aestuarianus]